MTHALTFSYVVTFYKKTAIMSSKLEHMLSISVITKYTGSCEGRHSEQDTEHMF